MRFVRERVARTSSDAKRAADAWGGFEFARQDARCTLDEVGPVTAKLSIHFRALRHTFFSFAGSPSTL